MKCKCVLQKGPTSFNKNKVVCVEYFNITFMVCLFFFRRPGFVRLNLPYFMSDGAVEFVLKAVELVAEHGWKLLPQVKRTRYKMCNCYPLKNSYGVAFAKESRIKKKKCI